RSLWTSYFPNCQCGHDRGARTPVSHNARGRRTKYLSNQRLPKCGALHFVGLVLLVVGPYALTAIGHLVPALVAIDIGAAGGGRAASARARLRRTPRGRRRAGGRRTCRRGRVGGPRPLVTPL